MSYPTELVQQARDTLNSLTERQLLAFQHGQTVQYLLLERSDFVDSILLSFWEYYLNDEEESQLCLIATGGYGRKEMHQGSDIDIKILLPEKCSKETQEKVSDFLTILWDVGLEIGHSVRTVKETVKASAGDISIATCIQESRLLTGNKKLFANMIEATGPKNLWPSDRFFEAKYEEQQERHQRYRGTAFNLEPNIKGNIGGLRDLQVIAWVLKRHFDANTFAELLQQGFLTPKEYAALIDAQAFLWKVRFALHAITKRKEDRLLFDHQVKVAELLNYQDSTNKQAVELFMRDYYRRSMTISRLNEMLLQMFREVIIEKDKQQTEHKLSEHFSTKKDYLSLNQNLSFKDKPNLLLEIFSIWKEHSNLRGITASTTRGIIENLDLIDKEFRSSPDNQKLFLDIFTSAKRLYNTLLRMNRYGVLGKFFPSFGRIVGHMQFDLFHAYTVDAHTLFVIKELEHLITDEEEHSQISRARENISSLKILFLSGLFHDIAKGRGGDHSTLGAQDVLEFGKEFQLSDDETHLLAWLVEQHLLLSVIAQKKDINDPEVIRDFAQKIPKPEYLHYLYLLTVADVKGTNPKLWNSWKASLFARLYSTTLAYFNQGDVNSNQQAENNRSGAVQLLTEKYSKETLEKAWSVVDSEYFRRHSDNEIAWHTELILERSELPVVSIREHQQQLITKSNSLQSLEIFISDQYHPELFTRLANILTHLNLDIYSAKLFRNKKAIRDQLLTAITFRVREARDDIAFDQNRITNIQEHIKNNLNKEQTVVINSRINKRFKTFNIPTSIEFEEHPSGKQTILEIKTADRPGLLALISSCIAAVNADLNLAKIMTIGEKAEDVFYISNSEKTQLNIAQQVVLHRKIEEALKTSE